MDTCITRYPMFTSKDLELLFFRIAPAYEVIKYIDFVSQFQEGRFSVQKPSIQWCSSDDIDETLYMRNDKSIDIALARIASPEIIDKVIDRNQKNNDIDDQSSRSDNMDVISRIILSAVQNRVSLARFRFESETWLKTAWQWILQFGGDAHYRLLFSNPSLPTDILTGVFSGKFTQEVRDKYLMYYVALQAPLLSKRPDDNRYGPDLDTHWLLEEFWKCLTEVDTDDGPMVDVFSENVGNFPYDVEFKSASFGFPSYGEPGYDSKMNILSYLELIIGRWQPSQLQLKEGNIGWGKNRVIEMVTSRIVGNNSREDKIVAFARGHEKVAVRKGFYQGCKFNDCSMGECEHYWETDGYDFYLSAVNNSSFYNFRDNKTLCAWFFNRIHNANISEKNDNEYEREYEIMGELQRKFRKTADELHIKTCETLPKVFPSFEQLEQMLSAVDAPDEV